MEIKNVLRREECPLCGAADIYRTGLIEYVLPVYFSTTRIDLSAAPESWKCRRCKSGFVQNVLSQEAAAKLYAEGASGERWSKAVFKEAKTREVIEQLGILFEKNTEVLDIGCNTGELLDFARSFGCRTTGVEFSEKSREELRQKGHRAFASINEVDGAFDVITAFDLVEHLYDVRSFIGACMDKLKKGGALVILTGNISSLSARLSGAKWWYMKYPEHIVFPSKRFFETISGLKLERWINTYASLGYKHSLLKVLISSVLSIGKYTGLPSIGPDHVLAVLRK